MTTVAKDSVIANVELWIAALRSGHYKQGQCTLRRRDAYCCLGVACDLMDPTAWEENPVRHAYEWHPQYDSYLATSLDDGMEEALDLTGLDVGALIGMNDCQAKSFDEIADYIEQTILPRVRARHEVSA